MLRTAPMGALAIALIALPGCFSPYKAIPGRSAIDQQVTAEAIRAAVETLDLEGLPDAGFYVRVSGPREVDVNWIAACTRDRLLREGRRVVVEERASHTFEVIVAHAASDLEQSLIGLPLFIPGLPIAFGSISLYQSSTLTGRAQLGAHVFDSGGRLALLVPEARATRFFKNESFLTFFGDFIRTDMEDFTEPGEEREEREEPKPVADGE